MYSRLRLCRVSLTSSTTLKKANTIRIKESHSDKVSLENMSGQSMPIAATLNMVSLLRVSKTPKTSSTQWEAAIKINKRLLICIGKLMVISPQENKSKEATIGISIQTNTDSGTPKKRSSMVLVTRSTMRETRKHSPKPLSCKRLSKITEESPPTFWASRKTSVKDR